MSFPFAGHPYAGPACSLAYAVYNAALGIATQSRWFILAGAYHAVLAVARYCAGRRHTPEAASRRITGILLIILSFCLIGINILSAIRDRGRVYHEIIMITIAAYTFARVTAAVIGLVRTHRGTDPTPMALRCIALADAAVSIQTLQRSMLVSFPGMTPGEVLSMNIATGTAVWFTVLLLGISLTGGKYVTMTKSRITQAHVRIASAVTGGYRTIENHVIRGYRAIEHGTVTAYTRVEDRFIAAYLLRDGETLEEARARLRKGTR